MLFWWDNVKGWFWVALERTQIALGAILTRWAGRFTPEPQRHLKNDFACAYLGRLANLHRMSNVTQEVKTYLSEIGARGGSAKSEAKARAARQNATKPRKRRVSPLDNNVVNGLENGVAQPSGLG